MSVLASVLPNFVLVMQQAWWLFIHGGWVIFVIGMTYMLWRLYIVEIRHQFIHNIEWVFLSIKVPRQNTVSTLAVEQIFSQLHALHSGYTFFQVYIEGAIQRWYSFEIISLGGKVSFVMRIPKVFRHMVEAAFYSQYPQAEISEIADYMENFNIEPDDPNYEILGTEFKLTESDVIPIKTYKDFEHPAAEEKIIDPLSNLFESLAKIDPGDFVGVQITAQPLADPEWHPRGLLKIKELIGEEVPHKASLLSLLLTPFEWFAKFSYNETFFSGKHGAHEPENKPRNNWMTMTEAEKQRVALIEAKIGKPGYKCKLRFLLITPTKNLDKFKRFLIIGAYRPFTSIMTNVMKPDTPTWVGVDPKISYKLEAPYLAWRLKKLKRRHLRGYKERSILLGRAPFILNTEELATLYHFPITTETTMAPSAIEKTESTKSQPPVDLPIAEL